MSKTVLVVEDDPAIRRGLVDALQFDGYQVIACEDGNVGMQTALSAELDLAVLDVMMPGHDGFEILAEVRKSRPHLPVILVTARGAEQDRIHGLEIGADDYVVKPFSSKELLARVGAVLRRSAERPTSLASTLLVVQSTSNAAKSSDPTRLGCNCRSARPSYCDTWCRTAVAPLRALRSSNVFGGCQEATRRRAP